MTTVAFDFDGTWTLIPGIMRALVELLQTSGHVAVMVTGRSDEGHYGAEVREAVGGLMPIVFAGDDWKRAAALAAGYKVDIWIDDWPEYVAFQYKFETVARRQGIACPPRYMPDTVRVSFLDGTSASLAVSTRAILWSSASATPMDMFCGAVPAPKENDALRPIRTLRQLRGHQAYVEIVPGAPWRWANVEYAEDTLLRAEAEIRRLRGET